MRIRLWIVRMVEKLLMEFLRDGHSREESRANMTVFTFKRCPCLSLEVSELSSCVTRCMRFAQAPCTAARNSTAHFAIELGGILKMIQWQKAATRILIEIQVFGSWNAGPASGTWRVSRTVTSSAAFKFQCTAYSSTCRWHSLSLSRFQMWKFHFALNTTFSKGPGFGNGLYNRDLDSQA